MIFTKEEKELILGHRSEYPNLFCIIAGQNRVRWEQDTNRIMN